MSAPSLERLVLGSGSLCAYLQCHRLFDGSTSWWIVSQHPVVYTALIDVIKLGLLFRDAQGDDFLSLLTLEEIIRSLDDLMMRAL